MPIPVSDPLFSATVTARRDKIKAEAPCTQCGLSKARCKELSGPGGPNYDPYFPGCCCAYGVHEKSQASLDGLLREIERGEVHTVAELSNRLNNRPHKAGMLWLLDQSEWWQPQSGPMVPVADLTDTHRLHLLRWLERRAPMLADGALAWMIMSPFQPSGDAACDAFEGAMGELERDPLGWLRETELYQALSARLPRPCAPGAGTASRKRYQRLLERASHYSTCPANRRRHAQCTCQPVAVA